MTASGKALHVLLSLAVIIALMAVPTGLTVPTSDTLAVGSAQPPPGEPGGNHSTPGDNKKKKRDEQRRSDPNWRRGSDQSDSQRQGDSRQRSSERPTSRVGAQQNEGSQQMPRQQTGQPREPHPRYPNRSTDGKYRAGNSGFDGYAEEQASWDAREAQTGTPIERKKIRVKITDPTNPNGPPVTREYDGLEEISPGKYRGLEHKVGSARLRPNQRLADGLVRSGIPGRGVLNGKPIEVVDVEEVHVPTPPPSAVAPAPAAPAAPAAPPPAVAPPAAAPAPVAPPAVAPPAAPAPPAVVPPPAPAAPPVAPPTAPLVPLPPAPVVAPPPADTGIAWGAMFHDYAESFYGPLVVIGGGLATIGGLLSHPLGAGRA